MLNRKCLSRWRKMAVTLYRQHHQADCCCLLHVDMNHHVFGIHFLMAYSAFHPSGVSKWVPASAGKAKAGMVHSVSGWTRGVQVKLRDHLRTRAIPERLRGVFTTTRYTNTRLPLPLPLAWCWATLFHTHLAAIWTLSLSITPPLFIYFIF